MEYKDLPTIPRWRTLSNAFRFMENPIPVLDEFMEEKGETFRFYLGGIMPSLLSIDPEINQHVLQKNHRNYKKSKIQTEVLAQYVGKGLLTIDGDYWLRQRRLIQPGFHKKKLEALCQLMQEVIEETTDEIEAKIKENNTIEISECMMDLAYNVIVKSLFSSDMKEEQRDKLGDGITAVQSFVIKQIRQPYLHWWNNVSGKTQKHLEISNTIRDILLEVVVERKNKGLRRDDLLDMLLESRYEDTGEAMTDEQLVYELAILFAAGHETSANALAWTWYLLTQNPETIQKLRAEFDDVLGDRKPTFEDLRKLRYTTQVIKESMRMYPPAWITDRVAVEDDEINGLKIPKGCIITVYIYGSHYNPKYWDKPKEFRPERFSKEKVKARPNFAYFPFGGGPRLCIGNSFAMMEMQLTLVEMLRRFDFTLSPNQTIVEQPLVTLRPKNGIKLDIKLVNVKEPV